VRGCGKDLALGRTLVYPLAGTLQSNGESTPSHPGSTRSRARPRHIARAGHPGTRRTILPSRSRTRRSRRRRTRSGPSSAAARTRLPDQRRRRGLWARPRTST
jgi:hypothetical protein